MRSRKPAAILTVLALVSSGALAACSSGSSGSGGSEETADYASDNVQVCQNKETGERVPDEQCEKAEQQAQQHPGSILTPFLWYYLGTRMAGGGFLQVPAVGSTLSGGSYTMPKNQTLSRVPVSGAKFSAPVVSGGKTQFVPYGSAADKYAPANKAPNTVKQDSSWLRSYGKTADKYGTGGKGGSSTKNRNGYTPKYRSGKRR